eukprot:scaffold23155_cov39-Tisochrysis_lutea.AAC.1
MVPTQQRGGWRTSVYARIMDARVKYDYIGIRNKPMPWALAGGSKCDLFDYDCAAKEKAAKAAAAE